MEVVVMLVDTSENRALVDRSGIGPMVRWVKGRGVRHYLFYFGEVRRCDVLHLIGPTLAGTALALGGRLCGKFVLSDWDELYLAQADSFQGKLRRWLLHYASAVLTGGYIFASLALQKWYADAGGKKPNSYIPYGLWELKRAPVGRAEAPGPEWVLYLGSYHRVYRTDLREVTRLAQVISESSMGLMLVGQGPELSTVVAAVRERLPVERVKVTGFVDDVDELLGSSNIRLCFLPLQDTVQNQCRCPNKMFHYAAAGKVILTNPVGEVRAILGTQAEYYDYGDLQSMGLGFERARRRRVEYDYRSMDWSRRAQSYQETLLRFMAHHSTRDRGAAVPKD
jgi:hypothetical protein